MTKTLLFLSIGRFYFPDEIPTQDKYRLLSQRYSGDVLSVIHHPKYNGAEMSTFVLRGLYLPEFIRRTVIRNVLFAIYAVYTGASHHYRRRRYDAIIAPDPAVGGLIALAIRALTGAAVVVEVRGHLESSLGLDARQSALRVWLRRQYVNFVVPTVLGRADVVRLLYPEQLRAIPLRKPLNKVVSFADFVPVSRFRSSPEFTRTVLFIGYPWFLKGVDVLIQAFNKLSPDFPDWSLRIVGYCPDKRLFVKLAAGNDRIALLDPVFYEAVIQEMATCSIFVLPSRTEAMGRVLLEAMASRKPVIGSNVDGIPSVIQDGKTGLLFESENVDDLADKMRRVMSEPEFAQQLSDNAFRRLQSEFSEANYLEHFDKTIAMASP